MRLLILLALIVTYLSLSEGTVVCYYSSWAVYKPDDGKFDVEDIDASLCSHIIYAYAGVNETTNEILVMDPFNDLCEDKGRCGFDRFVSLRDKYPDLKTMLGVGGWGEGSGKFSTMAASQETRKTFIDSALTLLKEHNFNGLDLDWEFPTQRGGSAEDKTNFVSLLTELREALKPEGMVFTAAVSAGKGLIDQAYDVQAISDQLDLINLMTYDFHGSWDNYTHHQSALYAHPDDTGDAVYFNVDYAVNHWLEMGADKNKLVVGIPLYGRSYELENPDIHGFYAPSYHPGAEGPWTREPGYLGYNEICYAEMTEDWTVVKEAAMNEPYAYNINGDNNIWVCYEDQASIAIKAQYVLDNGLAGCMVWSIETDDFRGTCNGETYPLLTTINEILSDGEYTKPPTEKPKPTTTPDPSRTTPAPSEFCSYPGPNPDQKDCTHYYDCSQGSEGWIAYEEHCWEDTLFNPEALVCDHTDSVCALEGTPCPNDCP